MFSSWLNIRRYINTHCAARRLLMLTKSVKELTQELFFLIENLE